MAAFYKEISGGKCIRLKDPTIEQLDDVLNKIVEDDEDWEDKKTKTRIHCNEAVLVYYIGHGVEHNNHTHAILKDGARRVKYDLEKMVNRVGKHRLVHTMFDCNRLYLNHVLPQVEKKYMKKCHYLYSYSAYPGRETKALNSVRTYIDQLTAQIDDYGLVFPSSVALLDGMGSIHVRKSMDTQVYIPLDFIKQD